MNSNKITLGFSILTLAVLTSMSPLGFANDYSSSASPQPEENVDFVTARQNSTPTYIQSVAQLTEDANRPGLAVSESNPSSQIDQILHLAGGVSGKIAEIHLSIYPGSTVPATDLCFHLGVLDNSLNRIFSILSNGNIVSRYFSHLGFTPTGTLVINPTQAGSVAVSDFLAIQEPIWRNRLNSYCLSEQAFAASHAPNAVRPGDNLALDQVLWGELNSTILRILTLSDEAMSAIRQDRTRRLTSVQK